MKIAIIGNGAIAQFVQKELATRSHDICALILRPERIDQIPPESRASLTLVSGVEALPDGIDHVIDCAGHAGLAQHGVAILRAGYDLTTLAIGALADQEFASKLGEAAHAGSSRLFLASGAIGGLDCLRAANVGQLSSVRYVGRKPPLGWRGSPAEQKLDLENLRTSAETHFQGSAREAALAYPKNANVAAAIALAGLGFEDTEVELIADPTISTNIHEIAASGQFGDLNVRISGAALPDNPRSSALAAMSVVSTIEQQCAVFVGC